MAELLNEKIGIFQLSTISWNLEFDKEIVVVFYQVNIHILWKISPKLK